MPSELQDLVESLADQLSRTVTVDDKAWRMQAYSSIREDADELRTQAILNRAASSAVREWAAELGLSSATEPIRTPENSRLGARARVVLPIRHNDILLGFLTLIDDGALDADNLARAERAIPEAAAIMFRESMVLGSAREEEEELLTDLLADDAETRSLAATRIVERAILAPRGQIAVLVFRLPAATADRESAPMSAFAEAVERNRRRSGVRTAIGLTKPDHAVILVTADNPSEIESAAERLRETEADAVVGVGGRIADLVDVPTSYRGALYAATAAEKLPEFAGVADWEELGPYRLILEFASLEGAVDELDPGFVLLLEEDPTGMLAKTLEVYLDLGGEAKRTADVLSLHRAGLYYRLKRIRELTDLDLSDGQVRLRLHLSAKLARVLGVWRDGAGQMSA